MHLPTAQFSRLVTILAFDLTNPSLDSMFVAWDHISTRYLENHRSQRAAVGKVESIRLLAVHDAVSSILGLGPGFIFNAAPTGTTLTAALAATAQASHDILANAFNSPEEREALAHLLEESLSLIEDHPQKSFGTATGAASAATFLSTFGSLAVTEPAAPTSRQVLPFRPIARDRLYWSRSA